MNKQTLIVEFQEILVVTKTQSIYYWKTYTKFKTHEKFIRYAF